jgi:hypothetical protein
MTCSRLNHILTPSGGSPLAISFGGSLDLLLGISLWRFHQFNNDRIFIANIAILVGHFERHR